MVDDYRSSVVIETLLFTSDLVNFPPALDQSSADGRHTRLGAVFGIGSAIVSVASLDEVRGTAPVGRCEGLIPKAEECEECASKEKKR